MVVAVDLKQRLDAHAAVASGLECIDANLHEPRRCCLTHDVRAIVAAYPLGEPHLSVAART